MNFPDDGALPMTVRDDPGLIDLPHPVRVDAAFGRSMEEALFGAEFWTALKPYLGDDTLPTEWILNHAPGVYELARDSSNFPGTGNLGLLSLVLARARLRAHGDPILHVHPALHEQLLETAQEAMLPVGSIDEAIEDGEIELDGRGRAPLAHRGGRP